MLNQDIAVLNLDPDLDADSRTERLAAILGDDRNYEPVELRWLTRQTQAATAIGVPVMLGRSAQREVVENTQAVSLRD